MAGIKNTQKCDTALPLLGAPAVHAAGDANAAQEGNQPTLAGVVRLLESGGSPVRIVCFGDSITGVYYHSGGRRAWCDMLGIGLQQAYPLAKLELHNAGVSGNTAAAGLARLDRDVLACKPHLVVVMFGMNDHAEATPKLFQDNLRTIVQRCRESGAAVVLCTPNSIYPDDQARLAKLPANAEAVRTLAAELSVPMADCYRDYENLRAADPLAWKLLMSETIHPCMNGHRFFAQTILETIAGRKSLLGNIPPPSPALGFTFDRLSRQQPVSLIAVPPYDTLVPQALRKVFANATIEVTPWPRGTLAEMEQWSRGIRGKNPTLVVVAVPANAQAADDETFIRSYNWILNWILAFGRAAWDTVAILPSVTERECSGDEIRYADLAQRVIAGKDMSCVKRTAGDDSAPETILQRWMESAGCMTPGGTGGLAR